MNSTPVVIYEKFAEYILELCATLAFLILPMSLLYSPQLQFCASFVSDLSTNVRTSHLLKSLSV